MSGPLVHTDPNMFVDKTRMIRKSLFYVGKFWKGKMAIRVSPSPQSFALYLLIFCETCVNLMASFVFIGSGYSHEAVLIIISLQCHLFPFIWILTEFGGPE